MAELNLNSPATMFARLASPVLRRTCTYPTRCISSSTAARQQAINYYKALEDFSQKKDALSSCWVQGEDQARVVPTYQLMNEHGEITNPDEFPTEVARFVD